MNALITKPELYSRYFKYVQSDTITAVVGQNIAKLTCSGSFVVSKWVFEELVNREPEHLDLAVPIVSEKGLFGL